MFRRHILTAKIKQQEDDKCSFAALLYPYSDEGYEYLKIACEDISGKARNNWYRNCCLNF